MCLSALNVVHQREGKSHHTAELTWEVYWGSEGGPEVARLGSRIKRRGEWCLPCMRGYSACAQGALYGTAATADEVFCQDPENGLV